MIISFSVFKEKILDGTKTQTIRRYSEFQYKRFCKAKKYQLYWGNPRNGGTLLKEVDPDDIFPDIITFRQDKYSLYHAMTGLPLSYEYTREIIIRDGFIYFADMWDWFYEHYGDKMFDKWFMVLRWKK